ncbi:putative tRNA/rRNA methyltransferase [Halioglobus japonicus]|nr:putative tRNA/rRNA methyltransferase [Halioglobus japonicus]
MSEPSDYAQKKSFFDKVVTVFGRKPVLETLQNEALQCHAVHLAHSNREAGIIADIKQLARQRSVPVKNHSREELSRISKNGRQDQGVAVDVICPDFCDLDTYLAARPEQPQRLLALDGITNPQNLGMIIRSAAAGAVDGILLPRKGTAALGPLVIKASAGTLYRAPLLLCTSLPEALRKCQQHGAQVCTLHASATQSLFQHRAEDFSIYVLGNETEGVSVQVNKLADVQLSIPMRNGVESLNVAVTASLIAYGTYLER